MINQTKELYKGRLIRDPKIMGGQLVVKGTRIPVETVIQHLADTPDFNDLFLDFPHLTIEDVQACLAYAYAKLERPRRRRVPATSSLGHAASA